MKKPSSLHTIIIDFGPTIPAFQQHFTDPARAGQVLRTLIAKMNKTANSGCIESLQLWHKGKMISTYKANPPKPLWIPPKDSNGVRHYPEVGPSSLASRRPLGEAPKGPRRLPSTIPFTIDPNAGEPIL